MKPWFMKVLNPVNWPVQLLRQHLDSHHPKWRSKGRRKRWISHLGKPGARLLSHLGTQGARQRCGMQVECKL
jgi:hypothetical protein